MGKKIRELPKKVYEKIKYLERRIKHLERIICNLKITVNIGKNNNIFVNGKDK